MTEEKDNNVMQTREEVNRLIDGLTLFDDDLMSRVFDKNIAATELILRIIFGRKIKVIRVNGQEEVRNSEVGGRNITLDVYALDENGEEMDIEVQGNSEGAHIRRARYHSSVLDSRMLQEGQRFKELKDSYVIFIYRHDKFRKGLPVYHIDRYVRETGEIFEDGSHIVYVNGNYMLLTRLVTNLVSNAYRYGVENGRTVVSLHRDGDFAVLSVKDNGIGIKKDDLEKIFHRFYQADPSHSDGGTGLGLSMVKEIAAFHHGTVTVNSEPGHGSEFIVRIPTV